MIQQLKKEKKLFNEPAGQYHSRSGVNLSSHLLQLFRKSPKAYHEKINGLAENFESEAYVVGRAAHTLISEGHKTYHQEYSASSPINVKTFKSYGYGTKKFNEWAAKQDKTPITGEHNTMIQRMRTAVNEHEVATYLLKDGYAELVGRIDGMQIRCDWLTDCGKLVDLKTTRSIATFEVAIAVYEYYHQLAFYQSVLEKLSGRLFDIFIIGVEKAKYAEARVYKLEPEKLQRAHDENNNAIRRLRECEENNHWPERLEDICFS